MDDNRMKVKSFISRFFRKHDIGDDDDIFSLGFVNSLFAMQLVMFLEKEFSIRIDNKDLNMDNFKTINAILHLIESKYNLN